MADGGGYYRAEFEPERVLGRNAGHITAFTEGYDYNVQVVPDGTPDAVVHLRLLRERVVRPGERLDLVVGPESTYCTDTEDIWVMDHRCAMIQVRIESEGTLRFKTRNDIAGLPLLFFGATSNVYTGSWRRNPGDWAVPVLRGTYWFFVGLPAGLSAQRIEFTTAMQ